MKRGNHTVTLKCSKCDLFFEKQTKEVRRQTNKNPDYKFYCSLNCANAKLDEFSAFRWFLSTAKKNAKNKHIQFDLTLDYVQSLWKNQNGKCAYTQIPMLLFSTTNQRTFKPSAASLDRIDATKGYVSGNVRFVCLSINYAKNRFSEQDFLDFLKVLRN